MTSANRLAPKRKVQLSVAAIYLCFTVYMLLCHLPLPYSGDDAYLLPLVGKRRFSEHFEVLYGYNGKNIYGLFGFHVLSWTL